MNPPESERKIDHLLEIMRRLRDPHGGCPWDLEQSFESIVPHTIEEVYEVADAIERADWDELPDELGDLLFQIIFYARLGEEQGRFDFDDIVTAICDKLVRRHPHVFGDASARSVAQSAQEQSAAWEQIKAQERQGQDSGTPVSVLDGIAALPAFQRALKLQRKAARVGFDWPEVEPVVAKVREEIDELDELLSEDRKAPTPGSSSGPALPGKLVGQLLKQRRQEELGDLLFAVVNLARHLDIDPEAALRGANRKFESRFRFVEQCCRDAAIAITDAPLDELERYWGYAKCRELSGPESSGPESSGT